MISDAWVAAPAQKIEELKPAFLYENRLRTYLQALYIGLIGSSKNAQLLIENQPGNINKNLISGNKLVRNSFSYAISWLELAREFSISEDIFNSQLLQPAILTAKFRMTVHSTVSLEGFIFSKSADFFDPYFGGKTVSLAIIVPVLQTVMNMRFRKEQLPDDIAGSVILGNVQPLPYVNRIHHYGAHLERTGTRLDLSSMHFLKTNIDDVHRFKSSMAFENLCEVYSTRLGKRLLGAPIILTGRLVSAQLPSLVINDPKSNKPLSLVASDFMLSSSGMNKTQVESLQGSTVRMLAVIWYGSALKGIDMQPEVFAVQPVDDETQAYMDNLIGFVRLRGTVSLMRLHEMFPQIDPSTEIPCIKVGENAAFWQCGGTKTGPVVDAFHAIIEKIRLLRQNHVSGEETLLAERNFVISHQKLNLEWQVHRISANRKLRNTIIELIGYMDYHGSLPGRIKDICRLISGADPDSVLRDVLWLRGIGFIAKRENNAVIRKRAVNIAYRAVRSELMEAVKDILNHKHAVRLDELENLTHYPPSLIILALRELNGSGIVQPLQRNERKCELVWMMKGPDHEIENYRREAEKALKDLEDQVLSALKEFPYQLHLSKLIQMLQMREPHLSSYTLMMVLSELEQEERLKSEGEMWMYPWEMRIKDFLSSRPHDPFTLEELLQGASFPAARATMMLNILSGMEKKGCIWQPASGLWCLAPRDEADRELILQHVMQRYCEGFVTDTIREHGGRVQEDWLIHELRLFIIKRREELHISAGCQCPTPDQIITDMLSRHVLVRRNAMLAVNNEGSRKD